MNVDYIKSIIEAKPNLSTALGMEFVSTPEDDTCMAHMKVDERNRQPFGFLSGGFGRECRWGGVFCTLSRMCLCGY